MQQEYFDYLDKIINKEKSLRKAKKQILHILLAHWFKNESGLSIDELKQCSGYISSVIYSHITSLEKQKLVTKIRQNKLLKLVINVVTIEELGREQREREKFIEEITK